jgi:hypothetical protein
LGKEEERKRNEERILDEKRGFLAEEVDEVKGSDHNGYGVNKIHFGEFKKF